MVAAPAKTPDYRRHLIEYRKCKRSFAYFADTYCQVLSEAAGATATWVRFRLWPEQRRVARLLQDRRLVVVLKARQLGLSWLVLAFALWLMIFHPIATVLLFSKRDDEAVDLLSVRLRGMYDRLPTWLRCRRVTDDSDHELGLSNGSRALAFPTTAGDSYTATLAICDEFDLVEESRQSRLMRSVKPTIDAGGRMILVSRSDKTKPQSTFKRVYRGAKQKLTDWLGVFLPWHSRPDRDRAWYAAQKADVLARTGSEDDLHEQYPATDTEALAPSTMDKRIAPAWLERCWWDQQALQPLPAGAPPIPGLAVYALPAEGHRYVLGVDAAEGNPTSDDSAIEVLDADTGEEAATLAGKFQPAVLAAHAAALARWYNRAGIMVERNNHGHAVLLALAGSRKLLGHDGKEGWLSSELGKTLLYDACADAVRNGEVAIHDFATFTQLALIEGATLRAPEGELDDRADSFALACVGRLKARIGKIQEPTIDNRTLAARAPRGVFG